MKYIEEYKILDNMEKINSRLYNAICRYENGNLAFANKLNLNIEELFQKKKPNNYYDRNYIIDHIKQFIKENSRFPSQQEMGVYSYSFYKYFKDFNDCKKEIGYYSEDDLIDNRGDVNRSYYELFTANFLIAQGFGDKYSREEHPFKDSNSGYRSDFTLYPENNKIIHIEVWADNEKRGETTDHFKNYLSTRKEKERLYNLYSNEITLISIEPSIFSSNLKSIQQRLYNIFKDYITLKYKTIDYNLLLPYNSLSEEQIFLKLMEYSPDNNRLPYTEEIKKIKGGYRLLIDINKRFGGLTYFSKKYNKKMSCKRDYWNDNRVFEIYDYMINTYGKFYSKEDNKKKKDINLNGFFSYINIGFMNSKLKYYEYLLDNNIILNEFLFDYLSNVANNNLKHVTSITKEQQELANQILIKYNHNIKLAI